jgi:hypothetical protein
MKLLGFAYLAVLLGVNSATAQQPTGPTGFGYNYGDIKVNYYSDSKCSDYSLQVNVTWASYSPNVTFVEEQQKSCYIYSYGGSVNIANCVAHEFCECWFYKDMNCGGQYLYNYEGNVTTAQGGWNCLANSSDYLSFMCDYY